MAAVHTFRLAVLAVLPLPRLLKIPHMPPQARPAQPTVDWNLREWGGVGGGYEDVLSTA